ncbi:MAG: hypothetical protein GC168_19785 [Candidatus Hydrogenedens sp.]|nr:hypothetical protein [Candidatus Hydrogenedens sp.]
MPYFDEANLRQLAEDFATVPNRVRALIEAFFFHHYNSDVAKEYAHHGVCRRLSTLGRCINQIYALIPPELDEVPPREVLVDATIFLQAFVFNAFGVLDNLAFVWVNEKGVKKLDGEALPNGRVGLTSDKQRVRESFSPEMQAYLIKCDTWFSYLENFRHSLGHRIPLYIPPYIVNTEDFDNYKSLDTQMNDALLLRRDMEEYNRLEVEQKTLIKFWPWMKHSLNDPEPPVVFHAQVLADFATIEEVGQKVLVELNR